MTDLFLDVAREAWLVVAQMSPFLLLGFLVAGLLSVYVSSVWLERHLGGRGMTPVVKAALFGVPLPLCSCGVIPVAASLRSHGASRAATTSFLLSTPQTGVDSIMVTWTLLGPVFAVFRPVVALLTGLLGGGLVQVFDGESPSNRSPDFPLAAPRSVPAPVGARARLSALMKYGLITLPADIGRALLVGVVLAGIIGAVVPPDFVARYVHPGPLSVLMMMLIGIPIYVCATASVPVAAGFIFAGVSPGAALAFLIAGPATNAATLTTIGRVLGRRTLGLFLAAIAISAFGAGLLLDWLLPQLARALPGLAASPHHHEQAGWWEHLAAVVLVGIVAHAWWYGRRRRVHAGHAHAKRMPHVMAVAIEGMHCSHCSESVRRAVEDLPGVSACRVDLEAGRAEIAGFEVEFSGVAGAIDALGFRARMVES